MPTTEGVTRIDGPLSNEEDSQAVMRLINPLNARLPDNVPLQILCSEDPSGLSNLKPEFHQPEPLLLSRADQVASGHLKANAYTSRQLTTTTDIQSPLNGPYSTGLIDQAGEGVNIHVTPSVPTIRERISFVDHPVNHTSESEPAVKYRRICGLQVNYSGGYDAAPNAVLDLPSTTRIDQAQTGQSASAMNHITQDANEDQNQFKSAGNAILLSSAQTSLSVFMESRGLTMKACTPAMSPLQVTDETPPAELSSIVPPNIIPPELCQHSSFHLPKHWQPPSALHRYLVSLNMMQKRRLYQTIASPDIGAAVLLERLHLSNVDIIVDPFAAIILFNLAALPAQANQLLQSASKSSWSYSRLLILFEAYPPSRSRSAVTYTNEAPLDLDELPNLFSPPAIKAFKQLRRSLVIADAAGTKDPASSVEFVFALHEVETACYIRSFGDQQMEAAINGLGRSNKAAENSVISSQTTWDDRSWLVDDEYEVRYSNFLWKYDVYFVPCRVSGSLPIFQG